MPSWNWPKAEAYPKRAAKTASETNLVIIIAEIRGAGTGMGARG